MGRRGFTFAEMSAVLVITGMLLVPAAQLMQNYYAAKAVSDTQQSMNTFLSGLSQYFNTYSRFPCPASISAPPGPAFGVATDCTDHSVPVGSCNADYCVIGGTGKNGPVRIRVGAIPFVQLRDGQSFPGEPLNTYAASSPAVARFPTGSGDTVDGYQNRLVYAVTEIQATSGYLQNDGGINIQDQYGNEINQYADYVLISHNRQGLGTYNYDGAKQGTSCSADTGFEKADCKDATTVAAPNAAVFVDALYSNAPGPNFFEDTLLYRPWMPYFLWEVTPANPNNITNLNTGNVGVGLMAPTEKLHLKDGNLAATGDLYTHTLCDTNPTPNCFTTDIIAGPVGMPVLPAGLSVPQPGLCPAGQAMSGIANSTGSCAATLTASGSGTCPAGQFAYGFTYDTVAKTMTMLCR